MTTRINAPDLPAHMASPSHSHGDDSETMFDQELSEIQFDSESIDCNSTGLLTEIGHYPLAVASEFVELPDDDNISNTNGGRKRRIVPVCREQFQTSESCYSYEDIHEGKPNCHLVQNYVQPSFQNFPVMSLTQNYHYATEASCSPTTTQSNAGKQNLSNQPYDRIYGQLSNPLMEHYNMNPNSLRFFENRDQKRSHSMPFVSKHTIHPPKENYSREIRRFSAPHTTSENIRAIENAMMSQTRMKNLSTTMTYSQVSQQCLQDWDKKMGLSKAHSRTMVKSAKSRKLLQDMFA